MEMIQVKTAGISVLLFTTLIGVSLLLDMAMGFNMKDAVRNTFNPFRVMNIVEVLVLILFLLIFLADIVMALLRKRKDSKKEKKKR
ncbi:hypothetical protein [Salibacterium sp. K-3]